MVHAHAKIFLLNRVPALHAAGRGQPLGAAGLRLAPHGQYLQELQLFDQFGADEGDARLQRGHEDGAQPARLLLRGHRRFAGERYIFLGFILGRCHRLAACITEPGPGFNTNFRVVIENCAKNHLRLTAVYYVTELE